MRIVRSVPVVAPGRSGHRHDVCRGRVKSDRITVRPKTRDVVQSRGPFEYLAGVPLTAGDHDVTSQQPDGEISRGNIGCAWRQVHGQPCAFEQVFQVPFMGLIDGTVIWTVGMPCSCWFTKLP